VAAAKIPDRIRWTVELLDVRPTEHLLEIGSGPGHAVALVCEKLTRGTITAIDRSSLQVRKTRERNRACLTSGRAIIEDATLEAFDPGRRLFAKIFAVNVNAFWTTPAPSMRHLRRLLASDGVAFLAYEPPSKERLRQARASLARTLEEHDFIVSDVRTQAFRSSHGLCIIGRRADAQRDVE
jgi:cyclopropane fatty-acyl-phospholipid synthase-like methyltransferase